MHGPPWIASTPSIRSNAHHLCPLFCTVEGRPSRSKNESKRFAEPPRCRKVVPSIQPRGRGRQHGCNAASGLARAELEVFPLLWRSVHTEASHAQSPLLFLFDGLASSSLAFVTQVQGGLSIHLASLLPPRMLGVKLPYHKIPGFSFSCTTIIRNDASWPVIC